MRKAFQFCILPSRYWHNSFLTSQMYTHPCRLPALIHPRPTTVTQASCSDFTFQSPDIIYSLLKRTKDVKLWPWETVYSHTHTIGVHAIVNPSAIWVSIQLHKLFRSDDPRCVFVRLQGASWRDGLCHKEPKHNTATVQRKTCSRTERLHLKHQLTDTERELFCSRYCDFVSSPCRQF